MNPEQWAAFLDYLKRLRDEFSPYGPDQPQETTLNGTLFGRPFNPVPRRIPVPKGTTGPMIGNLPQRLLRGGYRPQDEGTGPSPVPANQGAMLRSILPREATPSPALDRAYDAIRHRFPQAEQMHLQEADWGTPMWGASAQTFLPPMGNVVTFNPMESALASNPRLESTMRHEQRHTEQMAGMSEEEANQAGRHEMRFDYGRGPIEAGAWKAERDYYNERGFTPQDMQFSDPSLIKSIPGLSKDYKAFWEPRPFDPHWVPPTPSEEQTALAKTAREGLGRMMHNTNLSPVMQRVVPRIERLQNAPSPNWTAQRNLNRPLNVSDMGMSEREKAYRFDEPGRPQQNPMISYPTDPEGMGVEYHPGVSALFEEPEVEALIRASFHPGHPTWPVGSQFKDIFRSDDAVQHHFGQQGGVMPTVKNAFPW